MYTDLSCPDALDMCAIVLVTPLVHIHANSIDLLIIDIALVSTHVTIHVRWVNTCVRVFVRVFVLAIVVCESPMCAHVCWCQAVMSI